MGSVYNHNNHWMDGHMSGGMGWGGWLLMGGGLVVCLAILVAVVVWVVRTSSSSSAPAGPHGATPVPPASGILDERFARGEIDEQEYLQRRQALLGVHQS